VTCLFSQQGQDVKALLRGGANDDELRAFLSSIWQKRSDRYSMDRLEALNSAKYDPASHRKIEMISLGG
jgi:cyclic pyranopterin phosphate synthase